MSERIEKDALGEVRVTRERLWGAQTQRCVNLFTIGGERFRWGRPVIRALGVVKKSAALVNGALRRLPREKAGLIVRAAEEVIDGRWDGEFPLVVFQTGSGTQTNMNANEVIANRAIQLAGGVVGSKQPVHPNDDVNRSQSSNDVFPTVMHLAVVEQLQSQLFPAVAACRNTLAARSEEWRDIVMTGRTHLQDATPVGLRQVVCGWTAQLDQAVDAVRAAMPALRELAIGGTAVGTGMNAPVSFGRMMARQIGEETGEAFVSASNKFAALAAHDAMVGLSGALRTLAGAAFRIANDVRMYASGPRTAIGELILPENEPGSSIMPGKINPTQCEALTQAAVQVFGNDHAVAFAGSQGYFQLNMYKPVILHNVLESIELLASGLRSFEAYCVRGMGLDTGRIQHHLENSLMLGTALAPHIGYEKAAEIVLAAHHSKTTLRAAAIASGYVREAQFDEWVRPAEMTHPDPE